MTEEKILYKDLSYKIVGLAMQAHRELGPGFLEKLYENALMIRFEENGVSAQAQLPIQVQFHGRIVGDYIADILVENSILVELKAQERMLQLHKAQTLNYLRATNYRLALLLNFGKISLEHDRIIL
ncbi:MAG TPA: GxxExxY protein [Pyrinomonadaceae bacterium]|jgi:GxxExxY protein|nr:GxxExxY protein [Pyrinomonadaceae bacterium]